MDLPDLARIIEAHVAVPSLEPSEYFDQLRRDVSPPLRDLQAAGRIRWFSFLLHTGRQLSPPQQEVGYIVHLRLEPASDLDPASLVELLPSHFENPHLVPPLGPVGDLDASAFRDGDLAYGWKVFGEASEWVLGLVEAYRTAPAPGDTLQFLHYMTNPLLLGLQSVHRGTGIGF